MTPGDYDGLVGGYDSYDLLAQHCLLSSFCPVFWSSHSSLCGPVGPVIPSTKPKLASVSHPVGPEKQ